MTYVPRYDVTARKIREFWGEERYVTDLPLFEADRLFGGIIALAM
jgi:hypothetical protein